MNKEKAITYSLLTHIRNSGTLAKGPVDIFIPLIKRTLSKMNSRGIFKGKSLIEIKNTAKELYYIDFPIPVLNKILIAISKEINTEDKTHLVLYQDGAFSLNQYSFTDFEDIIDSELVFRNMTFKNILKKLERHYDVTIINNNTELMNEEFNANFGDEPIKKVLEELKTNYGVRYKFLDNKIIIEQ